MSINFATLGGLAIPEGSVTKITNANGSVLWENNAIPTLERASWNYISQASKEGLASSYWSVGDQKTIYIDGVAYLIDIIGFDHDTPTDTATYGRSKAGITFQMHDLLATDYVMNESATNVGSWKASHMRTSTMTTLFGQLNNDLSAVITSVQKYTNIGSGNQSDSEISNDTLFLISEVEAMGSTIVTVAGEGEQYSYYENTYSGLSKYQNGVEGTWWFRSPIKYDSTSFATTLMSGSLSDDMANVANSVSFAFCV